MFYAINGFDVCQIGVINVFNGGHASTIRIDGMQFGR
jgi:hypothetical protein